MGAVVELGAEVAFRELGAGDVLAIAATAGDVPDARRGVGEDGEEEEGEIEQHGERSMGRRRREGERGEKDKRDRESSIIL